VLNLIVTAIILLNIRSPKRAVATLRQIGNIPDHLRAQLSPLGWKHINLTGDYCGAPRTARRKTLMDCGTPSAATDLQEGSMMFMICHVVLTKRQVC